MYLRGSYKLIIKPMFKNEFFSECKFEFNDSESNKKINCRKRRRMLDGFIRMNRCYPSQSPLEVGEHVAAGLRPRVLGVELQLDGVEDAAVVVLDFALVHFVGKRKAALE